MEEQKSNDMQLVTDAQNGDEQALCQLYERYLPLLYRYCYAQCGHRQAAEDLTSDIFLKMVRQLPSFRFQASFKNWLYAIAKRTVADYWRRQYKQPLVPLEEFHRDPGRLPHDHELDIDQLAAADERHVHEILDSLPDNYRQVLECRFLNNMTIAETALRMNESEANVKVLQHRALKKANELFRAL